MNEMKRCSRCGKTLDLSNFGLSNKAKDGKQNYCKKCSREYTRLKRAAKTPREVKEVIPREVDGKELEILQMENKRLRVRFKRILDLYYLNEGEIL